MDNNQIMIETLEKENKILKENIKKIQEKNKEKIEESARLAEENKAIREQLDSILHSRTYKFAEKLRKIIKK